MLEGIDVSHWQGEIDWATVKPHISFAILKASEGTYYTDDTYLRNKQGCIDNGIPHGAYHFFRSNQDPLDQAQNFLDSIGPDIKMMVCDVETNDGGDLKTNLRRFVIEIEDATDYRPWIYTGPAFWRAYGIHDEQWCVYHHLWIAHYGVQQPSVPPAWSFWDMWQYSDHGVIPGIPGNTVDMNRFDGTEAELVAIFGNGVPVPPPQLPDKVRVTANVLNVRSTPGGRLVGYVPLGTIFGVTGQANDSIGKKWWKVGSGSWIASWWTDIVDA